MPRHNPIVQSAFIRRNIDAVNYDISDDRILCNGAGPRRIPRAEFERLTVEVTCVICHPSSDTRLEDGGGNG